MSFIGNTNGRGFEAGWFLANNEDCTRETRELTQAMATTVDDQKVVTAGTIYPADNSSAVGIVYEDINVTDGNLPGSVVTKGEIYSDRISITNAAKTALTAAGFTFRTVPTVTRPE